MGVLVSEFLIGDAMRFLFLTLFSAGLFLRGSAFADTQSEQLKRIVAVQNAQLLRLEAALKKATDRISVLEGEQVKIKSQNADNAAATASVAAKWNGMDLTALQRIQTVGNGVRLRAAPYVYDFREDGTVWFWKDGEPVESLTIQGNYGATQICRAHNRNCVKLY